MERLKHAGDGDILVGDIGGTHARFGLVDSSGRLSEPRILKCSSYGSLVAAMRDYLAQVPTAGRSRRAAIAVACPVLGDDVQITNHHWSFSVKETCAALDLRALEVVNDFIALALALPILKDEDTRELKPGMRQPTATLGLIGPGTGLGVSVLVPVAEGWVAVPTEGGHRDLAAGTEREWRIIERLHQRFGHVSAERVLSGPGLVHLYQAICEIDECPIEPMGPIEVVAAAQSGESAPCSESVRIFSRQLGAVAGDLALTVGARGGVFIGGGVLPGMDSAFDTERFREGFVGKGRFREYLEPIPVRLILNPTAALLGAARALEYDFSVGTRHQDDIGGARLLHRVEI
jgi:glucokinase